MTRAADGSEALAGRAGGEGNNWRSSGPANKRGAKPSCASFVCQGRALREMLLGKNSMSAPFRSPSPSQGTVVALSRLVSRFWTLTTADVEGCVFTADEMTKWSDDRACSESEVCRKRGPLIPMRLSRSPVT